MASINDPISDFDFMSDVPNIAYKFGVLNGLQEASLIVMYVRTEGVLEYDPIRFLNLVLMSYYTKSDIAKDITRQISIMGDCRMMITTYISTFMDEMYKYGKPVKQYNFDRVSAQVNGAIEMIKLSLENEKYKLEVRKLKQDISWIVRYLAYILSTLAICISAYSIIKSASPQKIPQKVQVEIVK